MIDVFHIKTNLTELHNTVDRSSNFWIIVRGTPGGGGGLGPGTRGVGGFGFGGREGFGHPNLLCGPTLRSKKSCRKKKQTYSPPPPCGGAQPGPPPGSQKLNLAVIIPSDVCSMKAQADRCLSWQGIRYITVFFDTQLPGAAAFNAGFSRNCAQDTHVLAVRHTPSRISSNR